MKKVDDITTENADEDIKIGVIFESMLQFMIDDNGLKDKSNRC
jgi:hypothetical protein